MLTLRDVWFFLPTHLRMGWMRPSGWVGSCYRGFTCRKHAAQVHLCKQRTETAGYPQGETGSHITLCPRWNHEILIVITISLKMQKKAAIAPLKLTSTLSFQVSKITRSKPPQPLLLVDFPLFGCLPTGRIKRSTKKILGYHVLSNPAVFPRPLCAPAFIGA